MRPDIGEIEVPQRPQALGQDIAEFLGAGPPRVSERLVSELTDRSGGREPPLCQRVEEKNQSSL